MIKSLKYGLVVIIIILSIIIVFSSKYYALMYKNSSLDEVLFYLNSGLKGANLSVIYDFFIDQGLLIIISVIVVFIPILTYKKRFIFEIKLRNKEINIFPIKSYKLKFTYAMAIFIIATTFSYNTLGVSAYLKQLKEYSTFIEEEYVNPNEIEIIFPEQKRNLIIIYLESMETTMINKKNGGGWEYSVIPELEKIALENINFSNTDTIGGAYATSGATWTVAGLVSATSGLPLKIPIDGNQYTKENFLPGAISLGDILKDEGYNLEFIFGSDSNFGGRYQYFSHHGAYNIFDLNTAIDRKLMSSEDAVFWGFEDSDLFEWAKQEIIELANQEKPFNFNLLTVNTHFEDGWLEKEAEIKYSTQYENVHAYSSKQVSEFVLWLQQQNFYKDTTVVLLGDHNSMQSEEYYEDKISSENLERVTYNAFLNTPLYPIQEKQRYFSSLDMYPTLLASIGVEISGNKLGLGTNLFSNEKTLFEKYGVNYVNYELGKNSIFYNTKILKEDYVELLNNGK